MTDSPDALSIAASIAAQLIQHYESCRLVPYADPGGIPTIGWGNTRYQDGTAVALADAPLTQDQADSLFLFWLQDFMSDVIIDMGPRGEPSEVAAFTSLAYNVGAENFLISSALREFRAGNKAAAGLDVELWDRSGGQVLKGLRRRRRAEHLVFDGMGVAAAVAQAEQDFP